MIGSLLKMARGAAVGPDEIGALLEAAGVDLEIKPLEGKEHLGHAFNAAAAVSLLPGARSVLLDGRMKNGEKLTAILVLNPA